jgi:hypothetical protein
MAKMQIVRASLAGVVVAPDMQEDGTTALVRVAATSDKFLNDGRVVLQVTTSAGADQMMTIESQAERFGLTLENREIALTASVTEVYGPFSTDAHNETTGADDGYTSVQFNLATPEVTAFSL